MYHVNIVWFTKSLAIKKTGQESPASHDWIVWKRVWIEGVFLAFWNVITYTFLIPIFKKSIEFVLINIISYMVCPVMEFLKLIINFANTLKTIIYLYLFSWSIELPKRLFYFPHTSLSFQTERTWFSDAEF